MYVWNYNQLTLEQPLRASILNFPILISKTTMISHETDSALNHRKSTDCSTVCSGLHQKKHQMSAATCDRWIPLTKDSNAETVLISVVIMNTSKT